MLRGLFGAPQERAITVESMWGPWYGSSTTNAGISVSRANALQLLAVFGSVHGIRTLWSPPLSRSAIYQWGEDVPELRAYQIHEMFPDINKRIRATKKERQAA